MYHKTREEEVAFLKKLWTSQPVLCPECNKEQLVPLHKKAKKERLRMEMPCVR